MNTSPSIEVSETTDNGPDLGIEVLFGFTPSQATNAQCLIMNTGKVPMNITLQPGYGIFGRLDTTPKE